MVLFWWDDRAPLNQLLMLFDGVGRFRHYQQRKRACFIQFSGAQRVTRDFSLHGDLRAHFHDAPGWQMKEVRSIARCPGQ